MLVKYLAGGVDLENSYVIGDRKTDIELANNLGCNAILFKKVFTEDAILCTTDWNEICSFLKSQPRISTVSRKTGETDINVCLNIDGAGKSLINTGIGFFDHMLDQIARHGSFDLEISAAGDITDDGHHIIEDVAICLGEAFSKAAGARKSIERYSFVLPMDDSLAQVALDMGGRPWIVWKLSCRPCDRWDSFRNVLSLFQNIQRQCKMQSECKSCGSNDHHKIEAIFKAFGRTLKQALKQTDNYNVPSTKGKL